MYILHSELWNTGVTEQNQTNIELNAHMHIFYLFLG